MEQEKIDRLDMLKHISFIGKKNLNLFKNYIPDHYDEVYSLFSLLNDAAIDYHNIEFDKPIEKDDSFVFLFTLKNKYLKKLAKYLEENTVFTYLRNKTFNVVLTENDDNISLRFKLL